MLAFEFTWTTEYLLFATQDTSAGVCCTGVLRKRNRDHQLAVLTGKSSRDMEERYMPRMWEFGYRRTPETTNRMGAQYQPP